MLRGFHIESVVNWLIIRWSHEDDLPQVFLHIEIGGKNRIRTCGTFYSPFGFQPNALNRALPSFQKRIPHTTLLTGRDFVPVFSALGPTVSISPRSYVFFYQQGRSWYSKVFAKRIRRLGGSVS